MWRKFDIVQLTTTRNIKFLSGPPGRPAKPTGSWSVVGNLPGAKLMIAKDETIVIIPITDVRKVGSYDLNKSIEDIKKIRTRADLEKQDKGEQDGQEEKR